MKYMGSKSRIAKHIVPIIQSYIKQPDTMYIEPFVGGCNVIDKIESNNKYGSDNNKYLIALLKHVQNGGDLPGFIERDEYSRVRSNFDNYEDWYVGAVGFLASYNGRFFDGGYSGKVKVATGKIRNYYDEAKRNLEKQAPDLIDIKLTHHDYRDIECNNAVIYCDKPYKGVKQYSTSVGFCHDTFWKWAREKSKDNIIIVSEHNAPDGFKCIWEQEVTRTVDNTRRVKATEKLFVCK